MTTRHTVQEAAPWRSTTAPRGVGIRRRRDEVVVPLNRARVACRCGRAQMLIGLVRAREAVAAAIGEPVARAAQHEDAEEDEHDADGQRDDDRDLLPQKRALYVALGLRRGGGGVGGGNGVFWRR